MNSLGGKLLNLQRSAHSDKDNENTNKSWIQNPKIVRNALTIRFLHLDSATQSQTKHKIQ